MTVMDFPSSPINGQTTTDGRYYFDSSVGTSGAWRSAPLPVGGLPAGSIIQWGSGTLPSNWLLCDGSAVSRSTYSSLFAAIGTQYGSGNGTTTFNLPDIPNGDTAGVVGQAITRTTITVNTGTPTDLPGMATTVSLKAGRTYRFTFTTSQFSSPQTGSSRLQLKFWVGATEHERQYFGNGVANNWGNVFTAQSYFTATSDSTQIIKLQGHIDNGTGTYTFYADSDFSRNVFTVEDLGESGSAVRQRYIIKATAGWTAGDSELATRLGAVEQTRPLSQNYVINGGFDIWQRGTSFSYGAPATVYTADRWSITNAFGTGTPAFTISRQSAGFTGIQHCLRFQRNSGSTATTNGFLAHSFESVDSIPLAGRVVTVSFYARAGANYSPASSVLNYRLVTGTGTDQNLNSTGFTGQVNTDSTATLTTSWQRFSVTITAPTNTNQIGIQLWSAFTGTAGAADFYEITGVQLEAGNTPTPFRRNAPSVQAELAACQRYYVQNRADFTTLTLFSSTDSWLGTTYYSLPVDMRVSPTIQVWDIAGNSGQAHRQFTGSGGGTNVAVSIQYLTSKGFRFGSSVAGATDRAGMYYFQWTASAEL